MNVIEAIRDYILERIGPRLALDHYTFKGGSCSISWTELVGNPKLKQKALQYTISLCDGYATMACCDLCCRVFEYADPAFPDNLLDSLPVLSLPQDPGLPHQGAVTPVSGE